MARTVNIIVGSIVSLSLLLIFGALLYRSIKKSEDPHKLIFKWVVTFGLLGIGLWLFSVPPVFVVAAPVFGVLISILWAPSIATTLFKPLTNIFDGGDEEPEPVPMYSIAEAKRKKGLYDDAVREIRKQLEKFPGDFTGTLLLASIMAEDLNDLPGAQNTIDQLLARSGYPPQAVASALHTLADWHLRYAVDPDAARAALERIINLFPNTPQAQVASQRIARLATVDQLMELRDRGSIDVPEGQKYIGLHPEFKPEPEEPDPAALAAGYVKQLEAHPLDGDTREKLAMLYAEVFQRRDLAVDQLEQLIAQPNESPRRVARWLDLLATVHIRQGKDLVSAEQALRRIIELFPGLAAAEVATARLVTLKSELKFDEKSQVKQLGSYEHNLGLKRTTE
jgi:tetratricopeptide (TPR) repeat protein